MSISGTTRRMALEGLVIVASILLAFALDAWWDNRQERAEVVELLVLMDQELAGIEARLDSAVAEHRKLGELALEAVFEAGSLYGRTEVIFDQVREVVRLSSLDALRERGGTGMIDDSELRLLLLGWDTRVEAWNNAERESRDKRDLIRSRVAAIGGNLGVTAEDPSAPLWTDQHLLNLVTLRQTDDLYAAEVGTGLLTYIGGIRSRLAGIPELGR